MPESGINFGTNSNNPESEVSFSRNQSNNRQMPTRSHIENSFDLNSNPEMTHSMTHPDSSSTSTSRPTAEITIDGDAAFVANSEIFIRNANIGNESFTVYSTTVEELDSDQSVIG